MDEEGFPITRDDVIEGRARAIMDLGLNLETIKDPKARKLLLRTMTLLADSIQDITAPEPLPAQLAPVTYLGKKL